MSLVLLCFLPRAWLCGRAPLLCSDGVSYLQLSTCLEEGRFDIAFGNLGLNVYLVVLVAIRRAGFDVVEGAAWWGVLMASLAVVPLVTLTGRLFGRRVAALAGVLYAVHPGLMAYSPQVLRDPTHWFLFLSALYLIWRAATEARMRLFLAAGAVLTLAVHCRTEAWLLLIPLAGWVAWRWQLDAGRRWRLVAGTAVCLAIVPLSVALVNVTLLGEQGQWGFGSRRHVEVVDKWVEGEALPYPSGPEETATTAETPAPGEPSSGALCCSTPTAFRKVAVRFPKALSPAFGLLSVAGLWALRRRLLSASWLPLPLVAGALLSAIAVRITVGATDPRYYLTAVLVLLPLPAAGLLWGSQRMARFAVRVSPLGASHPTAVAGACVLLVAMAGAAQGLWLGRALTRYWEERIALGKWIGECFGPSAKITDNSFTGRLVIHYAEGMSLCEPDGGRVGGRAMLAWIGENRPTVLLLWEGIPRRWPLEVCQAVLDHHRELGYQRVPAGQLPPQCRRVVVLVRDVPRTAVASTRRVASPVVRPGAAQDARAYPGLAQCPGVFAPVPSAHARSR